MTSVDDEGWEAAGDDELVADPFVGRTVRGFRILQLIRACENGRIYAGRSERSTQRVALKILHAELRDSRAALAAFEREQWFLREAGSGSVPCLVASGDDQGVLWYAMERIRGNTLLGALRAPVWPRVQATRLLYLMSQVSDELHSIGLSHGRLSPSGVLVSPDLQRISLVDVAFARSFSRDEDAIEDIASICDLFMNLLPEIVDAGIATVIQECCVQGHSFTRAADFSSFVTSTIIRSQTRRSGVRRRESNPFPVVNEHLNPTGTSMAVEWPPPGDKSGGRAT